MEKPKKQKLLKDFRLKKLEENYVALCKWVILRENSKTEKGRAEYTKGLVRIGEYEDELKARKVSQVELNALYLSAVDILKDSEDLFEH